MRRVEVKAYAKINLYLDVVQKQNNGFHDIESIMQTVSLADELMIDVESSSMNDISITCDSLYAPSGSDNIVYRAAEIYLNTSGRNAKVNISLIKNIPSPAGMGGGSSDAAAVLRGLNDIFGDFSTQELVSLAAEIGSDVPFCVRGGTQIARGRGELLYSCQEMPDCYIVVACEGEGLSTPLAYRMLDEKFDDFKIFKKYDKLSEFEETLGSIAKMCPKMYNIFECVVVEKCPQMSAIKNELIKSGAVGALMCGSGPAVFGVFDDDAKARNATSFLKNKGHFAELCVPVKKLI